jgi:hypothetical protein
MKNNRFVNMILVVASVIFAVSTANAVPNHGAIVWKGTPRAFVTSLYIGVLGRQPESRAVVAQWATQVDETAQSRHRVFWAFINSPEYQQSNWASQPREYYVYRTYVMQGDFYRYSVSKGPLGAEYYPQAGPFSYGLAMALKAYYEAYARR